MLPVSPAGVPLPAGGGGLEDASGLPGVIQADAGLANASRRVKLALSHW